MRLGNVRLIYKIGHIAQDCEHLQGLLRAWVRPSGVQNEVPRTHEGVADQRGGTFVRDAAWANWWPP